MIQVTTGVLRVDFGDSPSKRTAQIRFLGVWRDRALLLGTFEFTSQPLPTSAKLLLSSDYTALGYR